MQAVMTHGGTRPAPGIGRSSRTNGSEATAVTPELATLWARERLLVTTGLLLLLLAVPSAAGLWLDHRTITGAPAWLKPTKFALSTGIYALTLAWFLACLPEWRRIGAVARYTTVVVMWLEIAIIDLQAWRGVPSHFNVSTPLNAVLFGVMGFAIFTQTATATAVAWAAWRQRFADVALGWALRFAMTLTLAGALTGALMTQPSAAQLADARATGHMAAAGGHTIGGPDGGPGLPGVGWSITHGDLRVPHFVGLHAMQVLPLLALILNRGRRSERVRRRLVLASRWPEPRSPGTGATWKSAVSRPRA